MRSASELLKEPMNMPPPQAPSNPRRGLPRSRPLTSLNVSYSLTFMTTRRFILIVVAALMLATPAADAAIVRHADGSVARPEQDWLNRASIKLPQGVHMTLSYDIPSDVPTFKGKPPCGAASNIGTIYIICRSADTVNHEAFHMMDFQLEGTPWLMGMRNAYKRLYRIDLKKDWWSDEAPYRQRPAEMAAWDFEECATTKKKDWWWTVGDQTYKACKLFDRWMKNR